MKNKMLIKNKGKNGLYTIKVKKDYGVSKQGIKYYIKEILKKCKLKKNI